MPNSTVPIFTVLFIIILLYYLLKSSAYLRRMEIVRNWFYTHSSLLNFRMLLSHYNNNIITYIHFIVYVGEKFEALKKSAYRKHLATSVNCR